MELRVLHQHGWSISALAREFGLSRNTIKRELESAEPSRYPARAKPTELTGAQRAHVKRRLAVCPTIQRTDLHAELVGQYEYAGSYPAFARHLRMLRPARVQNPEIRFEADSGLQTRADWAIPETWPLDGALAEL
jgi:transposase